MISENMKQLVGGSSVIRAMFEEGRRLTALHGKENVFDFSLGNPSVPPPDIVKTAIMDILNSESPMLVHGYMNNSGYEDVRRKIAEATNGMYGTRIGADNVVMTVGAAGALNITFKTLLNPGDEVIVFAPYFGEYNNYVGNFSGALVAVPADTASFQPNLSEFEAKITPKTKAVIINSPNNPSGAVYSGETLRALASVLEEKQKQFGHPIYLVSDEPYRQLTYDGVVVPYITHYYKNTFVAYSFSKSLSLPGERIGFLVVPPEADGFEDIMAGLNVANRILGFVNAPSLFQRVAALCIGVTVDVSIYEKNRNLLYNSLTAMGYECLRPDGTFYMFPKTPVKDDKAFCEAAKAHNVLIVPGSAFHCPGHFRLAYCVEYATCENALNAFEKLMMRFK